MKKRKHKIYTIVDKFGLVWPEFSRDVRFQTISAFLKFMNKYDPEPLPQWQQYYKEGYRCRRCTLIIEKKARTP